MARSENLKRLLAPRHIAFIGGKDLLQPIRSSELAGYEGEIWVVNSNRKDLAGRKCYATVADLPEAPDASFIAVRRDRTIEVVRDLAALGAGGCVCYAAGFAEIGGEGTALQDDLAAAAGDLALVGPNCYGVLNYFDGVALWADQHGGRKVDRGIAIISQSGNISLNLTMTGRSVPLGYVISVGNQAVLDISDFLDAVIEDPRIAAVGLYIEGLRDVASFSRAAARALEKGIPVVALKVGKSELGAQVALSHTSSLAGSDRLYQALFDRLGIIRVPSIPGLLETLKLLTVTGPLAGSRLSAFTCSGGESALMADLAEQAGLSFPELTAEQVTELRPRLPVFATISNPLDYNTAIWGDVAAVEHCFATVMTGDFDANVLVIDYPTPEAGNRSSWDASIDGFIAAYKATGRPAVVASSLPELLPQEARARLLANGIAPLQGFSEAVDALGAAARYPRRREALLAGGGGESLAVPPPGPPPKTATLRDEWTGKRELAAFGLPVPDGRLVSGAEAPAAAARIGFPVALKAVSARLAHKTEAGAIALDLRTEGEVEAAVARVSAKLATIEPGPGRFLVERMAGGAVAEMIVGVKRDESFGLALVVGSGGVLVELVHDSATLLLPTDRPAVVEALGSLKVATLLSGYRTGRKGDFDAAIDAVMAVADFAAAHRDRLIELDVNPLLVLPAGEGVVAVDALVRMAD